MKADLHFVAAFIAPIVIVVLGSQSIYWFGRLEGFLSVEVLSILVGLGVGVWALASMKYEGSRIKPVYIAIYAPSLLFVLWWVRFSVACANGDCV